MNHGDEKFVVWWRDRIFYWYVKVRIFEFELLRNSLRLSDIELGKNQHKGHPLTKKTQWVMGTKYKTILFLFAELSLLEVTHAYLLCHELMVITHRQIHLTFLFPVLVITQPSLVFFSALTSIQSGILRKGNSFILLHCAANLVKVVSCLKPACSSLSTIPWHLLTLSLLP